MNARRKHLRSGIAMLLVVVLMAAAAIMGFAMLSSASMQAQTSRNSNYAYNADSLNQSATNLAMFYLLNPERADSARLTTSGSTTFYNPGSNVPLMNLADGSVSKIDVSLISRNTTTRNLGIDVTSTSGTAGSAITRKLHTEAQLTTRYLVKYAMASNDAFTIPSSGVSVTIGGNVRSDNAIGGLLSAISGSTIIPQNAAKPAYPATAVPTYSELNVCKTLPTYPGGTAQLISGTISGTAGFPAVNAGNPDAVFYSNGNLTLTGVINFTGTIIVKPGNTLTIGSSTVTLTTKKTGQPALIVGGDLIFNGGLALTTRALTVNGLCWLGGNMKATGTLLPTSQFTVNGALMWGGTNPKIDTTSVLGASYLHVNWPSSGGQTKDAPYWDLLYVPNLCDQGQIPKTIKVVSSGVN